MILMLSGEGASDIGTSQTAVEECAGGDFNPGPMAWIVDKLVEQEWNYSPIDTNSFDFVSENSLGHFCRTNRIGTTLPGKKRPVETGYFFKNARGLAKLAKTRAVTAQCPVGAVLFRDSDGTVSSSRSLWSDKVRSIEEGFSAEEFPHGVAMVPKPKSEAWLLCAVQSVGYQNCARLEEISGNDASPHSAKKALADALAARNVDYPEVTDLIKDGTIDPQRINMPSFDAFRDRLQLVARNMVRGTT